MKIFLLGLPGSGKTTLGKELANSLGISFVDLDEEVEKTEGMTIREIFEQKSEDHFRKAEADHLARWCALSKDFVMAAGGGTPCFFDNLSVINKSGQSIFLDVPPEVIAGRMKNTMISSRPLFARTEVARLEEKIAAIRTRRIDFYRQAHHVFSGEAITAREILEKIKKESQR